uniref:Cystatin domain-containing protein n=1 Tax=Castor canadensis TaxID=51338 RepID=A0A8C0WNJ5_CASCN
QLTMDWILRLLLATLATALVLSPEANVNDEEVQQVIDFVLQFYNDANDDLYASRAVRVMSAKQQVVAGILYYLKTEIGRTTCTKSQSELSDCPFSEHPDQQKREICNFQVHSVPWEHEISVKNYSCQST